MCISLLYAFVRLYISIIIIINFFVLNYAFFCYIALYFIMIKNILKGFIIGVGKIIPGVSGSMLAISLNVYEKMLEIIANIKRINFYSFRFLFSLFLGIIIGIVVFSKTIIWLLNVFYFPTMLLFVGLIIGGLPDIILKIKNCDAPLALLKGKIIFLLSFLFSYFITFLGNLNFEPSDNILTVFVLGLIEAFSSIVPGISGTAIFMSLGAYDYLLNLYSNIFNPNYFYYTCVFIVGVLVSTYVIAKIITYLLKNYECYTFIAILGFMSSAILVMIKQIVLKLSNVYIDGYFVFEIIIGIILCCLGFLITNRINKISGNN